MLRVVAVIAVALLSVAAAQEQSKTWDPNWVVPETAAQKKNPLAAKPDAAAGGKKLFARMCATCHGDDSHPQTNNAPDLALQIVQQETDGSLFWRISNGNSRKGMPSFSNLPDMQRWQLVLYIRTLMPSASAPK